MPKYSNRNYLRIHGKWYDITDFKHPGGYSAIGLGVGRDATVLFEAHHPFTSRERLKGMMKKYEVSDEDVKRLDLRPLDPRDDDASKTAFNWGPGGVDRKMSDFEREIHDEVYAYFQKESARRGISLLEATKATWSRLATMWSFILLTLISIYFLVQGHWWSIITSPVLAWIAAANTSHDAMHFSVSTKPWVNAFYSYFAPFTSSPLMWYHQHVIGHHSYPNISFRDPDLAHAPAVMRVHESISWKPAHRFQLITTAFIWTLGATLYMTLVPLKALMAGTFNKAVYLQRLTTFRLTRHLIGRLLCVLALWSWPWFVFPFGKACAFAFFPMFIHSFCFMLCTQLNHLTPQNASSSDSDYAKHQVVTSHSFSPDSYLVFLGSGGLNLQIEHHLFPTVNHCHLPQLYFIVKSICAKHNVAYHESPTFTGALIKYVDHLNDMSKNPKRKSGAVKSVKSN